jgi:ABC-2 type transport system permease protein
LLALMMEGRFDSAFKGKPSPLLQTPEQEKPSAGQGEDAAAPEDDKAQPETGKGQPKEAAISSVIERSPESARLILVSSGTLFSDLAETLVTQALGAQYLKPAELAQNIIDWSLEDQGLLGIRSRDHFARTLIPLQRTTQAFWEYVNYGLAIGGLALVWFVYRRRRRLAEARYAKILQEV